MSRTAVPKANTSVARLAVAGGGGIVSVFWAQAIALVLYGLINATAVAGGAWFGPLGRPRLPAWWDNTPLQTLAHRNLP